MRDALSAVLLVMVLCLGLLPLAPGAQAAQVDWVHEGTAPVNTTSAANAKLLDGRLLVTMGYDSANFTNINQTWILDPSDMRWERVADSPVATQSSSAAALPNGKVYIFGGMKIGGHYLENVLIYDVEKDIWSNGAECPIQAYFPRVSALDEHRILIAGGGEGKVDCYIYDQRTDNFTRAADLPGDRSIGALVKAGDSVYYFGGKSLSGVEEEVFRYDIRYDYWTYVTSLPSPNQGLQGAFSADGLIYLVGGGPKGGWYGANEATCHIFNPYTNRFAELPDAPEALRYVAIFVSPDGRLIICGGHDGGIGNADIYSLKLWHAQAFLSESSVEQGGSVWLTVSVQTNFATVDGMYGMAYLKAMGVTYATYALQFDGNVAVLELPISQTMPSLSYTLEVSGLRYTYPQAFNLELMMLNVLESESLQERVDGLEGQNQDLLEQNDALLDQLDELSGELDDTKGELAEAIAALREANDSKLDAMVGYAILVVATITLLVSIVSLLRKK